MAWGATKGDLLGEDAARVAAHVDLEWLRGKHVLIAGVTGLIGMHLARSMADAGAKVLGLTHEAKLGEDLAAFPIQEYDIVVHAAGYATPAKFLADPETTILLNTAGTAALLRAVKPGGKFLYLSSSEVYSGASIPHSEIMIGQTTPAHERAPYIEGKRCGEALVQAEQRRGAIECKIARVCLAYGPGVKKGDTRLMSDLIRGGLHGHIKLRDSGRAKRCYLYISDCTEMLLNILGTGKHTLYNVGSPKKILVLGLADMIAEHTGARLEIGPPMTTSAPLAVRLDMRRYFEEFDGPYYTRLHTGVQRAIEWAKQIGEGPEK